MMRWMIACLVPIVVLGLPTPATLAEVGASDAGQRAAGVVLAREGEPETAVWRLVRPGASALALNPEGEARGDVDPDVRLNPLTGRPEAVWAWWDGNDFEIAWSRFDGLGWSSPVLLTDNQVDDTAPRLAFSGAGDLGITWTRQSAPSRIWYVENDPAHGWSAEIAVSDGVLDASEPSIVWDVGTPRIAYHEETTAGGERRILAAGGDSPDPWPVGFILDLVALTPWLGELEQEIQFVDGRLYTVWVDGASHLAFSRRRDGIWQAEEIEPYSGVDDIPRAKVRVKARVARMR